MRLVLYIYIYRDLWSWAAIPYILYSGVPVRSQWEVARWTWGHWQDQDSLLPPHCQGSEAEGNPLFTYPWLPWHTEGTDLPAGKAILMLLCRHTAIHLTLGYQSSVPFYCSTFCLQNGYVFRLRIHYHRELVLMREAAAIATVPQAAKALKENAREMEHSLATLPLLTSTLHGYILCVCNYSRASKLWAS